MHQFSRDEIDGFYIEFTPNRGVYYSYLKTKKYLLVRSIFVRMPVHEDARS